MTGARLAPSFLPPVGVLELTYACNHACIFCSCPWFSPRDNGFDRRPELFTERWCALIDQLCALGVSSLAFTGGEPLLRDDLATIIAHAAGQTAERTETVDGELVTRQVRPELYLLSNGRAMSAAVLDLCERHGVELSMSLPGLDTFAEHTGGGDPQLVLDWFGRAHERGIPTTAGITVTRRNLPELADTIAAALLAGADRLLLNRFMPGGRGLAHVEHLSLRAADIATILDTAEDILRQADRYGSVGTELPKCLVPDRDFTHLRVGTRCSAALGFFVVGPGGWVRVCNHSEQRLEHIDHLSAVKDHPYWRRFIRKDYLPGACLGCPTMGDCDGGCREAAHVHAGAPDAPDPLLV